DSVAAGGADDPVASSYAEAADFAARSTQWPEPDERRAGTDERWPGDPGADPAPDQGYDQREPRDEPRQGGPGPRDQPPGGPDDSAAGDGYFDQAFDRR
ncbi:MAG TPA: hypothetical protein VH008_10500, partial [Pseudonocardia sp.]|nr:hypothetical protein [Pseudonocardia sp.]